MPTVIIRKLVTFPTLVLASAARWPGYLDELKAVAVKVEPHQLTIDVRDPRYVAIKERGRKIRGNPHAKTDRKKHPLASPGSLVSSILKELGWKETTGCGCAAMRRAMDRLGWSGCFWHRAEIVAWFVAKAREQGITVDSESVWGLLKAALKQSDENNGTPAPDLIFNAP